MKKLYQLAMAFMAAATLTFTGCSDSIEYEPAPAVEGEGVFFPEGTSQSIVLDATSGTFNMELYRSNAGAAYEAPLTVTYGEGAEGLFNVPATASFAEGANVATLTVTYDNIVRDQVYEITVSANDGTPYGTQAMTFSVSWPENWTVVSKNALLVDNLFSMYGVTNLEISGIVVEKHPELNKYRFRSPYDNSYFQAIYGVDVFAEDFEAPYIMLDGEAFAAEAPGKYYIAQTALGFKMVDGSGPVADATWETMGSVAGNLQTSAGPIGPNDPTYPLGSYDEKTKKFDLGVLYHNLDAGGEYLLPITGNSFTLWLDPALRVTNYENDFTWLNMPGFGGNYTSTLEGLENKVWMQAIQQADGENLFRFPDLYAKGYPLYFNIDFETGKISLPDDLMQNTGLTSFGNDVYVRLTSGGGSSYDAQTGLITLAMTFYLVDENKETDAEGNETVTLVESAVLAEATETFEMGGEAAMLQPNKSIDDYVGTWEVTLTDGEITGNIPVTITKYNERSLNVSGLSFTGMPDDILLGYDAESGLLTFYPQTTTTPFELPGVGTVILGAASFNSATTGYDMESESFTGGLTEDGKLKFINSSLNQGIWDSMIFLLFNTQGSLLGMASGYWNNLDWSPASGTSTLALQQQPLSMEAPFKALTKQMVPRRTYKTELNMEATPATQIRSRQAMDAPQVMLMKK